MHASSIALNMHYILDMYNVCYILKTIAIGYIFMPIGLLALLLALFVFFTLSTSCFFFPTWHP